MGVLQRQGETNCSAQYLPGEDREKWHKWPVQMIRLQLCWAPEAPLSKPPCRGVVSGRHRAAKGKGTDNGHFQGSTTNAVEQSPSLPEVVLWSLSLSRRSRIFHLVGGRGESCAKGSL